MTTLTGSASPQGVEMAQSTPRRYVGVHSTWAS